MSIVVKNIESFEIETTFQLSVIQETSVQLLVKIKTLDQSLCMPKTHQMKFFLFVSGILIVKIMMQNAMKQ